MSKKGKILRINLKDQSFKSGDIPKKWYEEFIGGEGFAAKILYDELQPGMEPLSEDNLLVFTVGPLTGTKAPCSGRLVVGFKSPLTGTIGISNVGGHLAPMIKRAGYDVVVVEGKSEKPVYISVDDDNVEFKDAAGIWGLDTE